MKGLAKGTGPTLIIDSMKSARSHCDYNWKLQDLHVGPSTVYGSDWCPGGRHLIYQDEVGLTCETDFHPVSVSNPLGLPSNPANVTRCVQIHLWYTGRDLTKVYGL